MIQTKTSAQLESETRRLHIEQSIKVVVPPPYRGGWDAYDTSRPEFANLKMRGEKWAKAVSDWKWKQGDSPGGLLLAGFVGCGKTHFGYALLDTLIRHDVYRVKAINSTDFFQDIRRCYDSSEHSEYEYLDALLNHDVLFFDDLGSESGRGRETSDFVLDRLYTLINRAQRNCKPTLIVSSNMSLAKLRAFYGAGNGERIVSRLEELTNFIGEFPQIDMRKKEKK